MKQMRYSFFSSSDFFYLVRLVCYSVHYTLVVIRITTLPRICLSKVKTPHSAEGRYGRGIACSKETSKLFSFGLGLWGLDALSTTFLMYDLTGGNGGVFTLLYRSYRIEVLLYVPQGG